MIKGYFVLSDSGYKQNYNAGNGVRQKIDAQIKALNTEPFKCDVMNLPRPSNKLRLLFNLLFSRKYKKIEIPKANFLYIRRIVPNNRAFIFFLKCFKKLNSNSLIIYEVPTFPYDNEHITFQQQIIIFIDKIYRKKLYKYVDLITTFSCHPEIFGIPAIQLVNGIDCSLIPPVNSVEKEATSINLIAVAQFAFWHGYDRLINGLVDYYTSNPKQIIIVHLVGEGEELEKYKTIIKENNIENYVIFYGKLSGTELDEVFNKSNIGVCSLGGHRKGLFLSSELKSREYLARGLPMVSSTKIDVIPNNFPYCLYVSEDDSNINFDSIVEYYNKLQALEPRTIQIGNIRKFAEENVDMDVAMKPVREYINQKNKYAL